MSMRAADRIIEKLKYSTWLRLFFDLLAKMGIRLTPYFVAREGIWLGGTRDLQEGLKGYQFRILEPGDMGPLSRLPGRPFSERHLLQRLEKGHYGFSLIKDGEVVAFSWANPFEARSELCSFSLRPHEAYFYDLYTVPAWRGNQLALYMRYHAYRYLSKVGLSEYYSVLDALNTPAVKFKKKLHARFVYKGISIKLFGRYKYNFSIVQSSGFDRRIRSQTKRD